MAYGSDPFGSPGTPGTATGQGSEPVVKVVCRISARSLTHFSNFRNGGNRNSAVPRVVGIPLRPTMGPRTAAPPPVSPPARDRDPLTFDAVYGSDKDLAETLLVDSFDNLVDLFGRSTVDHGALII